MAVQEDKGKKLIWSGRPSVSVYYRIYAAISVVVAVVLVGIELWLGRYTAFGKTIFPSNFAGIPYVVEIGTTAIIFLAYLAKVAELALLRRRNRYELHDDGLYIDTGILNLENVYVPPMGFSDARLYRPWTLRLFKRGNIIVDTNDKRHFELSLLENPEQVQSLIRGSLSHPTVRIEGSQGSL